MIDEATMTAVAKHGTAHEVGVCRCPCYEALLTVGRAVQVERYLARRMAATSPEALAALTLGGYDPDDHDSHVDGDPCEVCRVAKGGRYGDVMSDPERHDIVTAGLEDGRERLRHHEAGLEAVTDRAAFRAALHEAAGRCRDGSLDFCYDTYHRPPIDVGEWWPPRVGRVR
jgi:hypothetical protein